MIETNILLLSIIFFFYVAAKRLRERLLSRDSRAPWPDRSVESATSSFIRKSRVVPNSRCPYGVRTYTIRGETRTGLRRNNVSSNLVEILEQTGRTGWLVVDRPGFRS